LKIAILGAGAWGSALAISFAAAHEVRLWTRREADRDAMLSSRRSRYLPEAELPPAIAVTAAMPEALAAADVAIVATSTAGLQDVARGVASQRGDLPLLWACKGFDAGGRMPHEIVAEALPGAARVGALSGPSFALEVARGQPTAVVLASRERAFAAETAAALNSNRLRIYSSHDLIGVELGGAVKNVIAIAAGISDGLELGRNARAALVTRGLAEIVRLGVAMGGQAETFMGLTGLGDLVLTCTGDLSRNRQVGLRLASGAPLERILAELGHVSEGVGSARAVRELARRHGIDMPIVEAVNRVLFDAARPGDAVRQLLAREPKPEAAR
jgi:glycerol-3-phosphate dehydrogenase (NAD(P)+)